MLQKLLRGFRTPTPALVEVPEGGDPDLLVKLEQVGKRYGDFWAIRAVSLLLKRGESLGIVGLNGAGKSTLIQVVAGSLPPTEGSVRVYGRVAMLLQLGMGFDEDFSGLENLYLSASLHGLSRAAINAGLPEIERFAEIGDFITKPVRTYSSGMKMRLAFALLTQLQPDIIVIDEALSVGDAYFSHKCSRLLHMFRADGKSLIFVSHDPAAVKTFCDRAILMEKGLLVREGTPSDVLNYYNAIIALKEKERGTFDREIVISRNRQIKSGDGKAVISRWDLLDEDGKSARAIFCGCKVTIACYVQFSEHVYSPTIGFLIRDRLGNDVFGTNTHNLGIPTGTAEPGKGMEIAFAIPLTLGPGSYSVTLAVHAGRDHLEGNYDWRDNLIPFTIIPSWPFVFTGVVALPVEARVEAQVKFLSQEVSSNQELRFGTDGNAHRFTEDGWAYPEADFCWTLGGRATLCVVLPSAGSWSFVADLVPLLAGSVQSQRVLLQMDHHELETWSVDGPGLYRARITVKIAGELKLVFNLPDATTPKDLGLSDDARRLAIAFKSASFIQGAI